MKALLRRTGLVITAIFLAGGVRRRGAACRRRFTTLDMTKVSSVMAKGGADRQRSGVDCARAAARSRPGGIPRRPTTFSSWRRAEATLVVGGTAVDAKRTAADQMRAPSINGGTTYHLARAM